MISYNIKELNMDKRSIHLEELIEFIGGEAGRLGYTMVDISSRKGRGLFLDVVIDKEGGITLDECGDFNRKIVAWIDRQEIFGQGYTLDVSSPGLDRELRSDTEFLWAVGKQIKVKTQESIDGRTEITGKLLEVDSAESIIVGEAEGTTICIARDNIAKARLRASIQAK